jgi:hypothetical protein
MSTVRLAAEPTRTGISTAVPRPVAIAAAALLPAALFAIAAALFAIAAALPASAPDSPEVRPGALDRTSYAVGFSAGAGLRGVVPVSVDHFRDGLLDGLGGVATQARVMSRPELFSRIRDLMKRLSDAELAAVAARIDETQDR